MDMQSFPDLLSFENYCYGFRTMILNNAFTSLTVLVASNDRTAASDRCFLLCQSHSFVLYVCNNSPYISSGMSDPFMAVCTGAA
jgi:hypothetical protein